jgi:hypothetical protein
MRTDIRQTGIEVMRDMAWGTHFCLFYEAKADLLDTIAAYCKAGLESHEFCLWIVAAPVTQHEAWHALRSTLADLDRYIEAGSIEILAASDWYLHDGAFDLDRGIPRGWKRRIGRISSNTKSR